MKKILLSASLIAIAFLSNAQSATFDGPGLPADWSSSYGSVKSYFKKQNCNLQESGLTFGFNEGDKNVPAVTSPAVSYSSRTNAISLSFEIYSYGNGNADCKNEKGFDGTTQVTAYLVPATYSAKTPPTGADLIAQSATVTIDTGVNSLTIPITTPLVDGGSYRVYFSIITTSEKNGSSIVIDNVIIAFTENSVLPVSFKSFNAARNKNNVSLKWETASEQSNKGFYVQRSLGNGEWKDVAFVFSQAENGNSGSALSYSFNDMNLNKGVSQYRLLQVDLNSKGKYSEVRSVRGQEQSSKLIVFPNPSNTGTVNILFDDATAVRDVIVSDLAGRVVKQFKTISGNNLSIENLKDGYYSVQVTNHATASTTVEKVIIKKR